MVGEVEGDAPAGLSLSLSAPTDTFLDISGRQLVYCESVRKSAESSICKAAKAPITKQNTVPASAR